VVPVCWPSSDAAAAAVVVNQERVFRERGGRQVSDGDALRQGHEHAYGLPSVEDDGGAVC
jgi:hypothetical protein